MIISEISTEFTGARIKEKMEKRDGSCKRLDARFKFFPVVVLLQGEFRLLTELKQ